MVLLSEYQSIMVDTIFKHSGTIDKFIGDAVVVTLMHQNLMEMTAERF